MEDFENLDILGTPLIDANDFIQMIVRFAFNTIVIWIMIHCLYYRKSKRRDYYFTFYAHFHQHILSDISVGRCQNQGGLRFGIVRHLRHYPLQNRVYACAWDDLSFLHHCHFCHQCVGGIDKLCGTLHRKCHVSSCPHGFRELHLAQTCVVQTGAIRPHCPDCPR